MGHPRVSRQVQFPCLTDQVFAETVMGLFLDEAETGGLVNAVGGGEDALRPEGDFRVTGNAGEADTLINQLCTQSQSAGRRIDIEEA